MEMVREPIEGPVRVVVCFDDDYLVGTVVLLGSLLRLVPDLEVVALHPRIAGHRLAFIRRLFPELRLELVEVRLPPELEPIHWLSPTTSARMLIPDLLDWPRCLYVDSDILCLADLTPVYRIDLEGFPLAAIRDDYDVADPMEVFTNYWRVPRAQIPATGYPPLPLEKLFCPGFMVMDCEAWRRERVSARYFEWLLAHQRLLRLPNVCGTNVVTSCRFLELDHSVNASILCHDPIVAPLDPGRVLSIHYAGPEKPWNAPAGAWPELWRLWHSELARIVDGARRSGISEAELAAHLGLAKVAA